MICVLICLLCSVFLCGCNTSTSAIYNGVLNQTEQEMRRASNSISETAKMSFGEMLYNFAQGSKAIAPAVIAGSMAIGFLLLLIVRKERTWRKHIFFFFILGIPTLMFIVSYGLSILVTTYAF